MDAALDRYHQNARDLCAIALARLPSLIDPKTGLAVFRVDGPRLSRAGTSIRYTAMAALGVERAEAHGLSTTVDLGQLHAALGRACRGLDDAGDLGLILWATARHARPLAEQALGELGEFAGHARRRNGLAVHSTELAWIVLGLAEALAAGLGNERDVRARLDRAYLRLLDQRGASGLIAFARPVAGRRVPATVRALARSELGFFDAQVYAIMAALRRDEVVGDPAAREFARALATRLIALQRPLGQWPWHYNVRTGDVVDVYPVYSVHQDGMAPMALLAAERALGVPAMAAVAKGLEWVGGKNELCVPLAKVSEALIWRSIRRRRPFRGILYPLKAASLAGLGRTLDLGACLADPSMLEVDREFRPYHLGWCLRGLSELAASAQAAAEGDDAGSRPTLKSGALTANGAPAGRRHASNAA